MGNIKTLFDKEGNRYYPVTGTKAVFDPLGRDLEERLADYPARGELSNVLARESSTEVEDVYMPEMKVFDDEWLAAGGTVIASGRTYGCNGIDDLTYKEAVEIKQLYSKRKGVDYSLMFFASTVRALLPIWIPNAGAINLTSMFQSSSNLTKIVFRSNISRCMVTVKDLFATFHTCSKLKEIDGRLNVSNASNVASSANFRDCPNLEEVRIYGLKTNIYFNYSPKLSIDSISYLVDNAANTTAITVFVHPDVFAKLTDESNEEWHQVLIDAMAKNITFATV